MKLHKEGRIFVVTSATLFILFLALYILCPAWSCYTVPFTLLSGIVALFMIQFFRSPARPFIQIPDSVLSPCDGKVVIIQEVEEPEFFKDKRLQVSVFMSVRNVHINWAPMSGNVDYFRHHHGEYLVAWHEKASVKNERTSIVVNNGKQQVLFRQIAGYVARRIVSYVKEGAPIEQNQEIGFIKFGSRMDLFLPLGTEVCVNIGDIVVGTETVLAKMK